MLKLLLSILFTFYVAVWPACARVGDDEAKVWSDNKTAISSQSDWPDSHCHIIVFNYKGGEYFVNLLDGKVAIETYSFFDDTDVDEDTIKAEIYSYSGRWFQIKSPIEGTFCGVSDDKKYYFIIGGIEQIHSKRTLTIFGETWRRYGHKPSGEENL